MAELLAVVRLFLRLLHQRKNAGGACQCVLQFCHNRADVVKWFHILVCIGEQNRQTADGQAAERDEQNADQSNTGINDAVDKPCTRIGQATVKCRLLAVLHELLVDFCKTSGSALFISKGLDNGLTAHHLIDQRGLSAAHFTLLLEQTIRTAGDKAGDKKTQRSQHNDHQGNPEIFGEHENQRHQNGHDAGKQLGKSEQ